MNEQNTVIISGSTWSIACTKRTAYKFIGIVTARKILTLLLNNRKTSYTKQYGITVNLAILCYQMCMSKFRAKLQRANTHE